ncbi:MAG: group 1 glycosyl transferase [Parcubacteria group bacterium Gr01-1014_38]|nr:MAG: group 1 glycosyl transferase [Parcubacteria group bacterium Gr01-1014_38]
MRIALDGSDLAADRFEGPSVYAGELLPRLSRLLRDRGHEVTTYLPASPRGVTIVGEIRVVPGSPFWTQRFFAAALRRDRPDVLFMPIQMLPLIRPRTMKTVAVVHDLEFIHYPATYTLANRALLLFFTRHAVRNATQLIAVSQYTKDDVVSTYGRSPTDITVVHHGVAQEQFQNAEEREGIRERYQLPERYVLFVGALQPRKNIVGLITAFEELKRSEPAVHLVFAGGGEWKETQILARIETSSVRNSIHLLRRVPRDDLAALYSMAAAFVLPSFSEGFGMPVLEAMAAGTPVITSNTSSLPEVVGNAAVLVDPSDPSAMASAILRILRDSSLRQDMVAKGHVRASHFTWDRAAEQTAEVIEKAGA